MAIPPGSRKFSKALKNINENICHVKNVSTWFFYWKCHLAANAIDNFHWPQIYLTIKETWHKLSLSWNQATSILISRVVTKMEILKSCVLLQNKFRVQMGHCISASSNLLLLCLTHILCRLDKFFGQLINLGKRRVR